MAESFLDELQSTLDREIPMCRQMGIRVDGLDGDGLRMGFPLAPNRNHQQTAFAGSLNALCTITGWGEVFLLTRRHELAGSVVIHRSTIKYKRPVDSERVVARCRPVAPEDEARAVEMLREKGQAKIDLEIEIDGTGEPAVLFRGSYVITADG